MPPPGNEPTGFLHGLAPAYVENVLWHEVQIKLEVRTYLTDRPAPQEFTSSGRCILFSSERVLVMSNPSGKHILPGGRIEPGESISTATIRELREETGLLVTDLRQIGILVFQHLTPRPSDYRFPYPIFLNAIFMTEVPHAETLLVDDEYEEAGVFVPFDDALGMIPEPQRVLLGEMLRTRSVMNE